MLATNPNLKHGVSKTVHVYGPYINHGLPVYGLWSLSPLSHYSTSSSRARAVVASDSYQGWLMADSWLEGTDFSHIQTSAPGVRTSQPTSEVFKSAEFKEWPSATAQAQKWKLLKLGPSKKLLGEEQILGGKKCAVCEGQSLAIY